MKKATLTAALALAAMGLSACNDGGGRMVNSGLCVDFTNANTTQTGATPIAATDAAAPVDDCVRRWAYSLAGSADAANIVADATVAACGGAITRWNESVLSQPPEEGSTEALSITTGEPTNPMAAHSSFAHGRALLYVVEARAGRCAAPPVKNGVPTGT